MTLSELELNISDNSAKEFSYELLQQLKLLFNNTDTHAMSEYELYLKGRKEMLQDVITYLKLVKP